MRYFLLFSFAYSFLCTFVQNLDEISDKSLRRKDGSSTCDDFVIVVQTWLSKIQVP